MYTADIRKPLVLGGKTYTDVTNDVCRPIENKPTNSWWLGFSIAVLLLLILAGTLAWTVWEGIGTWNVNKSVMWGWDITNFVFWVGIGHAGTLISAVLLLFRQKWRMSINRSAEAMTIFAVFCAAIFPLFHMGRVWLGFWPLPLPNAFGSLWVNFNFWYLGLIPDIATIRDRATSKARKFWYGFFAMGWNGSAKAWGRYEVVALILAGISTPLVLSVHTIVSMDFATSVIPGWHTTIFPPYFVAGAIFSGFGMVLTLLLIARHVMNYENYITSEHLEAMTKIILLTGSIVGVAYITEFVIAAYSGYEYEQYAFANRMFGPYAWAYWTMMFCNLMAPQVFWSKWARTTPWFIFVISIVVNIGMWFERFVIIVTSLHRDFLPSSWVMYHATWVEVGIFLGTFGLFFTCFFLFAKFLPVINMAEVKTIIKDNE
jgi:Ni/Fe-hydrogenase subunit HybB-like protein